jgi:hypothetical protein
MKYFMQGVFTNAGGLLAGSDENDIGTLTEDWLVVPIEFIGLVFGQWVDGAIGVGASHRRSRRGGLGIRNSITLADRPVEEASEIASSGPIGT